MPTSLHLSLFYILFLSITGAHANFFLRTVDNAHRVAVRHTKGLAHDLRVAFGAILPPSLDSPSSSKHALSRRQQEVLGGKVYCKSGGNRDGAAASSSSSGGNGTSIRGSSSTSTKGGSTTRTSTASGGNPTATANTGSDSPYRLIQSYQGDSFFEGWDFWTTGDPTHGIVDYVDEATGRSNGILNVNSAGNAVMRVETTPQVSANRKSIRIQTQLEINKGLWIMDSVHMPTGCGTWPAFWTNGPNWPQGGEIDIVEGVSDYTNNQATIHTASGCTVASSDSNALGISGSLVGGTNCAALETNNQGCGVRSPSSVSFGAPFNKNGGGVYASEVSSDGVKIWFWPRDQIPNDVQKGQPSPSNWGKPLAKWSSSHCNPDTFFYNQAAIFDTTLCGDWAAGVWNEAGIPGQEQSCAQRTGVSTCEEYVRKNGGSFSEAYWEVKSVNIYQLE